MLQQPRPTDLPMRHRRRPQSLTATGPLVAPRSAAAAPPSRRVTALRAALALLPLAAVACLLFAVVHRAAPPPPPSAPVRPLAAAIMPAPDDEDAVTAFRVPPPPAPGTNAAETMNGGGMTTCMPTVSRGQNGSVEYVSNAAKSWYLAHNGRPPTLRVFDMDAEIGDRAWRDAVGQPGGWLQVLRVPTAGRKARRRTFGDSEARVTWRAKEAQDYAAVLRACAAAAAAAPSSSLTAGHAEEGEHADGPRTVLVVQDDVLFSRAFARSAARWARDALRDGAHTRVNRQGVRLPVRVCSGSLFDMGGSGDEHLTASNLVARVWRVDDAPHVAAYFERRFDHAPVDWLADQWCRRRHAVVEVLRPNPVRHRGRVSSFAGNEREGTLT